ncbi:hypothetical protein DUI87_24807 [Hirundo rustica rustica]|uniref:Uncharacterized protein n=1 Tax=Hirundo rustica rustica TaxID=333673 RepID=A0A3M0JBW7_HIRRU|nr:hypothetical protein DUI87_24807 [Hirundo rustica rustica]
MAEPGDSQTSLWRAQGLSLQSVELDAATVGITRSLHGRVDTCSASPEVGSQPHSNPDKQRDLIDALNPSPSQNWVRMRHDSAWRGRAEIPILSASAEADSLCSQSRARTMFKRSEEPSSPDQNMARRILEVSLALGTVQVVRVVFG